MNSTDIPSADVAAWTIAEGEYLESPTVLRFRPNLAKHLGHPHYPRRLTITWEFGEAEEGDGQPSSEQLETLHEFEDSLIEALDHDRTAILAFVFTHGGNREWNFYIHDVEVVGERINALLSDRPGLPINLEVEDDAQWSEMANVLEGCEPS